MEAPDIDKATLKPLIQHVFLLPKLPDKNYDKPFKTALPKLLEYALKSFESLSPENCKAQLRQCRHAISYFMEIRSKDTHRVDEEKLLKLLKKDVAPPIPLYLEHHNAALSPKADAVTSTAGRLRRTFPEISARIRKETATEPGFLQVLAESLAQMDTGEVQDARPTVLLNKKEIENKFDALLPNHIFEPFFGFLFTETADDNNNTVATTIVKQTRDFAQYVENENKVIRRSPIWLLLKVVLQQELMRKKSSEEEALKEKTPKQKTPKQKTSKPKTPKERTATDNTLYKQFMLYFFSLLLDIACSMEFDSHTLQCMARKIGYRTQKLRHALSNSWLIHVEKAVKTANGLIAKRWQEIVRSEQEKRAPAIPKFQSDEIKCYVQHKGLDEFLNKVRHRAPQGEVAVPDPKSDIINWPTDKLPNIKQLSKEKRDSHVFNLIKIEEWVEDNLAAFVTKYKDSESSCSNLKLFAVEYFKLASAIYKGTPEHLSVMYLVLLELWVACDKIAVSRNPLLDGYVPLGVDEINFELLMLRTRKEIQRLAEAEMYVHGRTEDRLNMIGSFGTPDCFSSRFAQSSQSHQTLKKAIEQDMKEMIQKKSEELEASKEKQRKHFEAHRTGECDPSQCRVGSSDILCERCNNLAVGSGLTISVCEELLPRNSDLANSYVFELQVPPDISAWRDLSLFLLMDVAGHINNEPQPVGHAYMQNHQPLQSYFQSHSLETKPRICLASKPPTNRRGPEPVTQKLKLSDICEPHLRKWKLFDSAELKYVKEIELGSSIEDSCGLTLDDSGSILRKILSASGADPDCPRSQNELISMRLEAENTSILKHNEELGSLCFGNNATWPKILRELCGTSIDWTASETFLIVTKVALQVSPMTDSGRYRQRHVRLRLKKFSSQLLVEILRLLPLYTASFSWRRALAVFCTIIHKILAAGPKDCHEEARKILNTIRNTCFKWLIEARVAGKDLTSDKFEIQFDLALICAYTFSVDSSALRDLLASDTFAEQYIFASSIIHESKGKIATQFQASLYATWQRLAVNASQILVTNFRQGQIVAVANALCYNFGRDMQLEPDEAHFGLISGSWVKTSTWALDQSFCKVIHLNLASGEILIDGKCPAYLSADYLEHADFIALFGEMNPAVTAIDDAIYQYQFRHTFKGFTIQVGIEKSGSKVEEGDSMPTLHVAAATENIIYVLVPGSILSKPTFTFPQEYLTGFFHWHDIAKDEYVIDLHSCAHPWDSKSVRWHLEQSADGWMLRQHGFGHIVMPTSALHYTRLLDIFEHFLAGEDLRVVVNQKMGLLEICLQTLGLSFYVECGSTEICSVEYEDMYVDHHYSFKALIGLDAKLVLRSRNDYTKRTLLLADGEESCLLTGGHTEIQITIDQHTSVQSYTINEDLGQLKGNNTWRSLAWLAYLSALTSHSAPDEFTGNTGQETALDILNSGAMVSFDHLESRDYALLEKISLLSPERQWKRKTGANLRTLKWSSQLTPELHHEGFWFSADRIFKRSESLHTLRRTISPERKTCSKAEAVFRKSLGVRLACFRTTAYAAYGHGTAYSADYYYSPPEPPDKMKKGAKSIEPKTQDKRKKGAKFIDYGKSEGFSRAYRAALGAKNQTRFKNNLPSPDAIMSHIASQDAMKSETPHYDANNFRYAAGWRNPKSCTLVQDFCAIHKAITTSPKKLNRYRLRLWLSTIASGMEESVSDDLIPILCALIGKGSKLSFEIPKTSSTNHSLGSKYSEEVLITRLDEVKSPFQEISIATESDNEKARKAFIKNQNECIARIAKQIALSGVQSLTGSSRYVDIQGARRLAEELITAWDINKVWHSYCKALLSMASSLTHSSANIPTIMHALPTQAAAHISGHFELKVLTEKCPQTFSGNNGWRTEYISQLEQCVQEVKYETQPALDSMPEALHALATKQHEKKYIDLLETSIQSLKYRQFIGSGVLQPSVIEKTTRLYKAAIEDRLRLRQQEAESELWRDISDNSVLHNVLLYSDVLPRVSLRFFLTCLSFSKRAKIDQDWCELLKQIADLCRDRQHMNRILRQLKNENRLLNELETLDRNSYDSNSFPDAVLLEIEQDLTLRRNQMEIAQIMRDPPERSNAVMQLNMGEGKSSVIIPILSASLAGGNMLARVFVGRHQFKQMMDTLSAAFGGLINRPIFCFPFNRDSNPTIKEIDNIKNAMNECKNSGGIVLLQPEHKLSQLLSTWLNEDTGQTKSHVNLLQYFHQNCRDIIDESDELLSPTYELLYTIGTPGPVDFAPDRWILIQSLLALLSHCVNPQNKLISGEGVIYEKDSDRPDAFPRIRFVTSTSIEEVLSTVAREFLAEGLTGFPVRRFSEEVKDAMLHFITTSAPDQETMRIIGKLGTTVRAGLALVRGCISGDILRVALQRKRWRVDYGCDFERAPATRLAVPFAAKDVPKPRAEFSNIDIVIIFTHLSYYRSGLREADVRELIEHMRSSDDGHGIYEQWFDNQSGMPRVLRSLKAVNLQDEQQFQEKVLPNIRHSSRAINHFLSRLVFPTELGAFSQHISASGWDLGAKSMNPTTGFSGTTDLCALLPLDMTHCDLPTQQHTNALVLNNILDTRNTVLSIDTALSQASMDGTDLVDHVINSGQVRVIIDVGAQIIKLNNQQVAERWLYMTKDESIKAVVFFNDSGVLSVLDRSNTMMPLKTSVFAKKLDVCAVFLDEAHTRGTDLRLPDEYKAAVTLGPGLTKDRLVQACMRMRNLGKGQTLIFYVSVEVEREIRNLLSISHDQPLTINVIVQWSISQTWRGLAHQVPYWAKQGIQHKRHREEMDKVFKLEPQSNSYEGAVKDAIEDETGEQLDGTFCSRNTTFITALRARLEAFGCKETASRGYDETCEREVAPEVEDEKQVSKPPKPKAAESFKNKDLEYFIKHGRIQHMHNGFEEAFESLNRTSLIDIPRMKGPSIKVFVTRDFAMALDTQDPTDSYQQHVTFVLHLKSRSLIGDDEQAVVIISTYDVEFYWRAITDSSVVNLHLYNAKVTPELACRRDHIYLKPSEKRSSYVYSTNSRIVLDIFAGQLYFASYEDYTQVSSFLGLAYFDETDDIKVEPDGFIPPSERHKIPEWHQGPNQFWDTFESSPVPFLKQFLTVVRNHGASIEHTHMGKILDGEHLGKKEFPNMKPRTREVMEAEKAAAAAAAAREAIEVAEAIEAVEAAKVAEAAEIAEIAEAAEIAEIAAAADAAEAADRSSTWGTRRRREEKRKRDILTVEEDEEPELRELRPNERPPKRVKTALTPAARAAMAREAASKQRAAAATTATPMAAYADCPNAGGSTPPGPPKTTATAPTSRSGAQGERLARPAKRAATHENRPAPESSRPAKAAKKTAGASASSTAGYSHWPKADSNKPAKPPKTKSKTSKSTCAEAKKLLKLWKANGNKPKDG
ncbi:hypothetical protein NLG97_g2827 [Lecanicillium saksenae]|uniref:Uncharacterized protein n=1 Tax=Lecanicillium saksenae TaxID=468837 RepID=A0ACC1R010_9HYPO|nr:hypothetical protein NLG97_g2827 [Lecanicillium saksenae]